MKRKKLGICVLIVALLSVTFPHMALAGKRDVVSLGADLTAEQRKAILQEFGVSEDEVNIIEVSIQDVKEHLEDVTSKEIGTKAYSSAYVKLLPEGEGLSIDTHNVTLVTEDMYANALITAGVKDAEVKVTAPFEVTGTTALTGIMMAFEQATGRPLNEEAKKTANAELLLMRDIGAEFGNEKATDLIQKVKTEILSRGIKTPEDMRQAIIDIANELGLKLSDEQIEQILRLMERISKLDINVDNILSQLDKIGKNLEIVKNTIEENKGILQRIIDVTLNWLRSIFG